MRMRHIVFPLISLTMLAAFLLPSHGQAPNAERKARLKKSGRTNAIVAAPGGLVSPALTLNTAGLQEDYPAMCLSKDGDPVVAYIEYDGTTDTLQLAGSNQGGKLDRIAAVSEPGIIYQPRLARAKDDRIWCVWSQLRDEQWDLLARPIAANGRALDGESVRLTDSPGNDIFADAKTDRRGRVWVAWQRFENGHGDIFAKHLDPETGRWSAEIRVTRDPRGDWEPRLAFGEKDEALIVFDTYRNGNFDVYLARVTPAGEVKDLTPIADSARYEARAGAACSPGGETLWVTFEDGVERWGKDLGSEWRVKGGGLHHDRRIKVAKVDLDDNVVTRVADITPLIPDLVANPADVGTGAIDVPEIAVDHRGNPWVFFRYCLFKSSGYWQIAFTRLDPGTGEWTQAESLGESTHSLDRRCAVSVDDRKQIHVAYPSDGRRNKQAGDSGIFVATIDPDEDRATAGAMPFDIPVPGKSELRPFNDTPERDRDDHHTWSVDGEEYTLYWGDVHRHTDFSNCRTTDDGCIVEHFRYAYDAGGLDYLATSDHTEASKNYTPYEWWQTQKLADLFQNPGFFLSFYAYEREQKWPYGHRNVVFLERGGPIIYIERDNYAKSPWATPLPPEDGELKGELAPWQLWDLLRAHGQRAVTIAHTPAGGMGTDWSKYDKIDSEFETILEIFQGSRESYEGVGAPQPGVVTGVAGSLNAFGKFASGTWQNALRLQHRLGAYASSDHRSLHVSYGGVYVKNFTREGVFEAMDARRTVAATDKIYMEFTCNGRLLGEIFETNEKPHFEIRIEGTAPIERVTLIRNEEDYEVFPAEGANARFEARFTDPKPLDGENRYYLRVEQTDGNMGWASPVWVTWKP